MNTKIITREKVEERIPFCFGIIQRIADDLNVTRTAVSRFLSLPENKDLKDIVHDEKKRMREYAEMTVMQSLLGGCLETSKWYLTTFGTNSSGKKLKPYKPNYKGIFSLSLKSSQEAQRGMVFPYLDYNQGTLPGAVTKYLPYEMREKIAGKLEEMKEDETGEAKIEIENKIKELKKI